MLPNFNRTVEGEPLIVAVWQLEGTFSIADTNLRALGLAYGVWGSNVSNGDGCIKICVMEVY